MQKKLLFFVYLIIAIFISHLTFANNSTLKFRQYSLSSGLSQGTAVSLVQDHDGYIWIGTQDGLNRFDGYNFKVFQHEIDNVFSLNSNYINALHVNTLGDLWVGTNTGLQKLNKHNNSFSHFRLSSKVDPDKKKQHIHEIIEASNNKLWVGSNYGLHLFDPITEKSEHYPINFTESSTSSQHDIYALMEDNKNQLWIGSRQGISILNLTTKKIIKLDIILNQRGATQGDSITDIAQGPQGNIWVGTYHSGLIKIEPHSYKLSWYKHDKNDVSSISHNRIRSLLIDRHSVFWIGTANGVNIYNAKSNNFKRYYNNPAIASSLSNDYIWDMIQDNNDSVWLGTSNGVNQFIQSTVNFGHNHKMSQANLGLSHQHVRSLFKSKSDTVWIGVDNGLNKYDPQTQLFTHFKHDPLDKYTISPGMIMAVFEDSKKRVWAGSYNNGLNQYISKNKFKHFTHDSNNKNSISHNRIYAISEDQAGYLWIGTLNGLNRFDPETNSFKHYFNDANNPNSISDNSIYAILPVDSKHIWIATRNGGINLFNQETGIFKRFMHDPNNKKSISNNRVFSIFLKNKTELWAGTTNGLNKLDISESTFTRYHRKQGLLNDTIYAVTGDKQNNIWFSTNRGLTRLNPSTNTLKNFDQQYGLQSNEFNNGSFFKAYDNELFFGGINGFNRFYPSLIIGNNLKPKVALTQFFLANKPQSLIEESSNKLVSTNNNTKTITLNYKQPVFSFEFTALHFTDPKQNNFAYKLDGFDNDWTYTNPQYRRATYTNLPAGNYKFKVKAANRDGLWGENSQPININIMPPPWKTLWAYSLYILIITGTLGAFILQRHRKQQAIAESEKRLTLSLWASGNEFWDLNLNNNILFRSKNNNNLLLPKGKNFTIESMKKVVHPEDFESVKLAFISHINNKSEYFECVYRLKNNLDEWVWVLDKGKVIKKDKHGNAIRLLGTIQNINDLKTIENKLRQLNEQLETRVEQRTTELTLTVEELAFTIKQLTNTQLELAEAEKMAALGHLVSGISHEINTPIGICITSISVLQLNADRFFTLQSEKKLTREKFEQFKQSSLDSISLIDRNLHRTAELVQSFKLVSVDQSGDDIKNNNVKVLIQYIIDKYNSQLKDNLTGIKLECDSNITINCFSTSLDLVVSQLIQNTLLHGNVKNQSNEIKIEVTSKNQQVIIQYQDEGKGLLNTKKEQVFEPFYTTLRSQGHLGLGMHIAYNHVTHRLNGSIEIIDNDLKGLAYIIMIPLT